jgi:methylated-DNA-[protein]-cysteine S-methyltransferase
MSKRTPPSNDEIAAALRSPDLDDAAEQAAERFARAADDDGVLDVGYATVDSPLGTLLVAATKRGLVRVSFPTEGEDNVLFELSEAISPRVLHAPARLDEARRELDEYFEGRRDRFDLRLDWRLSHGFYLDVLRQIARVPYGDTLSYAEVAAKAGRPRAFRAAGTACGSNPIPLVVPCHRIVASGGGLGGYGGGLEVKRFLLDLEGAR